MDRIKQTAISLTVLFSFSLTLLPLDTTNTSSNMFTDGGKMYYSTPPGYDDGER